MGWETQEIRVTRFKLGVVGRAFRRSGGQKRPARRCREGGAGEDSAARYNVQWQAWGSKGLK